MQSDSIDGVMNNITCDSSLTGANTVVPAHINGPASALSILSGIGIAKTALIRT